MSRFDQDPDFMIEWPPELLEAELRRLVLSGRRQGTNPNWRQEVETLLRQAFSSSAPLQEFTAILDGADQGYGYEFDEEPF